MKWMPAPPYLIKGGRLSSGWQLTAQLIAILLALLVVFVPISSLVIKVGQQVTVVDGVGQVGPVRTEPEYRGKGCGLAIVNFCTRQSRKDGAEATFGLNDPGGPATGICETAGYSTAGTRQLWQLRSE